MDAKTTRMAYIGLVCSCGANLPVPFKQCPFPGIYFCLRCGDGTFLQLAGVEDGSGTTEDDGEAGQE